MEIGLSHTLRYTLYKMSMKMTLVGAFLTNTIFGQVCMMPMAHAEAMPMQHEHDEMEMTPLEPMSPVH